MAYRIASIDLYIGKKGAYVKKPCTTFSITEQFRILSRLKRPTGLIRPDYLRVCVRAPYLVSCHYTLLLSVFAVMGLRKRGRIFPNIWARIWRFDIRARCDFLLTKKCARKQVWAAGNWDARSKRGVTTSYLPQGNSAAPDKYWPIVWVMIGTASFCQRYFDVW